MNIITDDYLESAEQLLKDCQSMEQDVRDYEYTIEKLREQLRNEVFSLDAKRSNLRDMRYNILLWKQNIKEGDVYNIKSNAVLFNSKMYSQAKITLVSVKSLYNIKDDFFEMKLKDFDFKVSIKNKLTNRYRKFDYILTYEQLLENIEYNI